MWGRAKKRNNKSSVVAWLNSLREEQYLGTLLILLKRTDSHMFYSHGDGSVNFSATAVRLTLFRARLSFLAFHLSHLGPLISIHNSAAKTINVACLVVAKWRYSSHPSLATAALLALTSKTLYELLTPYLSSTFLSCCCPHLWFTIITLFAVWMSSGLLQDTVSALLV